MSNIAQVEFFYTGTESERQFVHDLRNILVDGLEAALLGESEAAPRLKTVVRFFDECGFLSSLVRKYQSVNEEHDRLFQKFLNSRLRRPSLDRRMRNLSGKSLTLREDVRKVAINQLVSACHKKLPVAIELPDHRFRLARHDELHELCESVTRARSVWVFLFAPQPDLLADTNIGVAHII